MSLGENDTYAELTGPRTNENGSVVYDTITFGNYPEVTYNTETFQYEETGESKPITWRVLSLQGTDAFLMAEVPVARKPYNEGSIQTDITWENCTLRSWLNGYNSTCDVDGKDYSADNFISKAFTSQEQNAILSTRVKNEDDPESGTVGGNDTEDKIFLLSMDEACNQEYGFLPIRDDVSGFAYDSARDLKIAGEQWASWWLRMPVSCKQNSMNGRYVGNGMIMGVYDSYCSFIQDDKSVCPVLHLDLSACDTWQKGESVVKVGE